eukprot:1143348-Pelagomonas_calceolata.AAC.3
MLPWTHCDAVLMPSCHTLPPLSGSGAALCSMQHQLWHFLVLAADRRPGLIAASATPRLALRPGPLSQAPPELAHAC